MQYYIVSKNAPQGQSASKEALKREITLNPPQGEGQYFLDSNGKATRNVEEARRFTTGADFSWLWPGWTIILLDERNPPFAQYQGDGYR